MVSQDQYASTVLCFGSKQDVLSLVDECLEMLD